LLLSLVKENGLFYFDSYTTPKTKARKAARATGVAFAANEIFVDLKDDHEFMKKQCNVLLKRVKRYGTGIAIGHIQKKNIIPVLKEVIPEFRKEGVEFVYLPDLVKVVPLTVAHKEGKNK
ncbi:MAG: divergent polysaccharide deacetylase family protein, partial [Endomicrobiales bacterium]